MREESLCARLVRTGRLSASNAERALRLQQEQPRATRNRIGTLLVTLGFCSEQDVAEALAVQLGVKLLSGWSLTTVARSPDTVSRRFLQASRALIVEETEDELIVAMVEPQDAYVRHAIELAAGKSVVCCLGLPTEIDGAIAQLREAAASADEVHLEHAGELDDVEQLRELAGEAPIIRFVNQMIRNAAESGASDIHVEPFEDRLRVRFRVDGMLREADSSAAGTASAIVSRIKIMAGLNIAERRLSQDGRFRQRVRGHEFDLRVSTVPTMHGESVVLRLLRRDVVELDFGPLGFSAIQERQMRQILDQPHGLLLVTGPTGSGKSTTIYAALRHLNQPERMIVTIEDPIEYNIRGINQIHARPQIGLSFATALRAIVRQDPDVIMIGEMRDLETAEIAVQSALTGHLVLSTLHTNDAPGSILRLLDMGVQDYLVTSAVSAVQAQRLVRTLCAHCSGPYEPADSLVQRLSLERFAYSAPLRLRRAVGCDACGGTGFAGRTTILEILRMSDPIRQLVMKRPDVGEIAEAARDDGMVSMRDDGLRKVVAGITTIEEVLRVTPDPRIATPSARMEPVAPQPVTHASSGDATLPDFQFPVAPRRGGLFNFSDALTELDRRLGADARIGRS